MSSGRTSWRDSRLRQPEHVSEQKRRRKWGVTLLLIACVALFVWLVFPKSIPDPPRTVLIAGVIPRTNWAAVAELPYPELRLPDDRKSLDSRPLPGSESSSLRNIAEAFPSLGANDDPPAAAIVLLRAEGVSWGGRAWLLGSDFSRPDRAPGGGLAGAAAFRDILQGVAQSPAQTKLLICDYGRTSHLADLGLFRNAFAELVEQDVKALDAPGSDSVFVLLSHGPHELSQLQHARRGTVFLNAVTDALARPWEFLPKGVQPGAPAQLTLPMLLAVVEGRCALHCRDDLSQTPRLLQGGKGRVEAPDLTDRDLLLLATTAPKPEPAAADESGETPGESTPKAAAARPPMPGDRPPVMAAGLFQPGLPQASPMARSPHAPRGAPTDRQLAQELPNRTERADRPPAAPDDAAAPGDSEPSGGPPSTTPASSARPPSANGGEPRIHVGAPELSVALDPGAQASLEAWEAYESLRRADGEFFWSPVDFSPTAYRDVGRELCRLDLRLWAARGAASQESIIRDLQAAAESLRSLRERIRSGAADVGGSAGDVTQERIRSSLVRMNQDWGRFQTADGASRGALETEFAKLPAADSTWARGQDVFAALPVCVEWFEAVSLTRRSDSDFAVLNNLISRCDDVRWDVWTSSEGLTDAERKAFAESVDRCVRELQDLRRRLQQEARQLLTSLPENSPPDVVSCRTAEVLLSTPLLEPRQRGELLNRLLRSEPEPEEAALPSGASRAAASDAWRETRARERAEMRSRLISLDTGLEPLAVGSLEEFGDAYLGQLRDAADGLRNLTPSERHIATLLIDFPTAEAQFPVVSVQRPPEPERLELTLVGEGDVMLSPPGGDPERAWRTLTFQLARSGPLPREVRLAVEPFAGLGAELEGHDPGDPLRRTIPAEGPVPAEFTVRLRANRLETVWRAKELRVTAQCGILRREQTIGVHLPTANTLRLATRDAGRIPESTGLRAYPSGRTPLGLAVINDAGRPLRLELVLLRSPEPLSRRETPEWNALRDRLIHRETGRLTADGLDLRLLAGTADLAVGEDEQPLTFAPPVAEAAPDAAAGGAAATLPAALAPTDVSHGLICVVREVDPPAGVAPVLQVFRLPIRPLHPAEYLEARASYDPAKQRIAVHVTRKHPEDRRPIKLQISNAQEFRGAVASEGDLEDKSPDLYVSVPEDGLRRRVEVGVDGYPRAFVFQMECRGEQTREYDRGHFDIRIRRLSVEGRPWAFEAQGGRWLPVKNPRLPMGEPVADERMLVSPQGLEFAPFRAPVDVPLIVDLMADVPAAVEAEIVLGGPGLNDQTFPTDRQRTIELSLAGEQLALNCALSDWAPRITLVGRVNHETELVATLKFIDADRQLQERTFSAAVRLDGEAPVIDGTWLSDADGRRQLSQTPAESEAPVFAWAEVHDPGPGDAGIAEVQFQIGELPPIAGELRRRPAGSVSDRQLWAVNVRPLLKDLPAGRMQPVEVTATDRLGRTADPRGFRFLLAAPAKPAMAETPAAGGVIRGKMTFNSRPMKLSVELQGVNPPRKVKADSSGAFEFRDVPPGTYTLKVKEAATGFTYTGELAGVKPAAAGEAPQEHEIELMR
ncbi:MAG: hypothetical protein KF774_10290 [Planctomyces sp.]|nr:hypothetical protein [Planctomyces sp.]